jgi:hypothetical protein
MQKLTITLLASAALAFPAAAWAHHGHHGDFAKLSGTGTSFAASTATASGAVTTKTGASGSFAATIDTDWSKAFTRTTDRGTFSCAPATAKLTLTGATAAQLSLTGKTCTWTPKTGSTVGAFGGRSTTTKAFLFEKADGTVKGAVFAHTGERRFDRDRR